MLVSRLRIVAAAVRLFISCGAFTDHVFLLACRSDRQALCGRHEDGGENYICSSCSAEVTKRDLIRRDYATSGLCEFAKNLRFCQVGAKSRQARRRKKPVVPQEDFLRGVYCCFAKPHRSLTCEKQILWPKATSFGARFARDDDGGMYERLSTTVVVRKIKNHKHLPSFRRSRSMRCAKNLWFSVVSGPNRCASHKSSPCRPVTLQIHYAARNLPTSLGVRRPSVFEQRPFGEKNPWNLMRIMPPQGSVEVSHRSCHGSRFFPPFLRSLFMERT